MARATAAIYDIFEPFGKLEYLQNLVSYTAELENTWNQPDTWREFFRIQRCGSGGQQEAVGGFKRLISMMGRTCLVSSLPSTLSRFPFENFAVDPKEKNSFFLAGIIGGNVDSEEILVPVYDYAITFIDGNKLQLTEEAKASMEEYIEKCTKLNRLSARSIAKHLEEKRTNGKSEEQYQQLERERLESVTRNYNIWFRGINTIPDGNKGDYTNAIITLKMYQAQLEEAKYYYECISTPEKLRDFYDQTEFYNKLCSTRESIHDKVFGTLNIDIYKNFIDILPEDEKLRVVKMIGITYLKKNQKQSDHEYCYQPDIRLDDDLSRFLGDQFDVILGDIFERSLKKHFYY